MRLPYGYVPNWPFYAVSSMSIERGVWDRALSCQLEAVSSVPNPGAGVGSKPLDVLSWQTVNGLLKEGILSREQWAIIDKLIDHDAMQKDIESKLSDCH